MEIDVWYDVRNPQRWQREPATLYAETTRTNRLGRHPRVRGGVAVRAPLHRRGLPCLVSTAMLGAMAMRTTRMRLGTAVLLAPLYHPLRLAEDMAVVDALSGGRLDLGIAPGYRLKEFEVMGVPKAERGTRTDEIIELLDRRLDDTASHVPGASLSLRRRRRRAQAGAATAPAAVDRRLDTRRGTAGGALRRQLHARLRRASRGVRPVPRRVRGRRPAGWRGGDEPRRARRVTTPNVGGHDVKEHYFYVRQVYQQWFAEAATDSGRRLGARRRRSAVAAPTSSARRRWSSRRSNGAAMVVAASTG